MRATNTAERKANELFLSLLTPEERQEWLDHRRVTVTGSNGGVYWLCDGSYVENIFQIDPIKKRKIAVLCVAPNMFPARHYQPLPTGDAFVGQLLGIRYNESEVLRVAYMRYYSYYD